MKINQLLQAIPSGAVVTTTWLAAHEVSADQARKLAGSGWLRRVGHGAYSRPGDALSWGLWGQVLFPASPPRREILLAVD